MLLPALQPELPDVRWYRVDEPRLAAAEVELWICSLATAEPMISGNKWMKLQYHIKLIQQQQYRGFVTFGGAFSNHLAACAAAAKLYNISATAYVRADAIDPENPTLQYCVANGMQLIATDRATYRQRHCSDFIKSLARRHPDCLFIPEGGSSVLGARGIACLDLSATPAGNADIIATATASGGTLAGLILAAAKQDATTAQKATVLGLAVLNDHSLPAKVRALLPETLPNDVNWQIISTDPLQRYARCAAEHVDFCCQFAITHGIAVEPVYTGRALYKLYQMVAAGDIAPGSRISFLHTGGMQGLAGLYYRKLISLEQYQILCAASVG